MYHDYAFHQIIQNSLRQSFSLAAANLQVADTYMRLAGFPTLGREFRAASQFLRHTSQPFEKQPFGISSVAVGNETFDVTEKVVLRKPFGDLLHFERQTNRNDPKVLLIAPMSGHYSTLLRGPVETLLPLHDVYITDWKNARDIPLKEGAFGLDDYVTYIEDFLHHLGTNTHVIAICQPTVPLVAAVSHMAEQKKKDQPLSMSLIAGPIDTRINPTETSRFAKTHSLGWYKKEAISVVPRGYMGEGRQVCPGYKQLLGFVLPQMDMHTRSHMELLDHLRRGDGPAADVQRQFHNEFYSVMDMSAQFYLETVDKVFKRHLLPKGELVVKDQLVRPEFIENTAILIIEGEKDEIVGRGQTQAVHSLTPNLAPNRHFHHEVPNVGHFAAFDRDIWKSEIALVAAGFIRSVAVDKGLNYSEIPPNTRLIPPNFWQKIKGVNRDPEGP